MNHVVIKDSLLNGWEYGMLRSFESAIVEETGAQSVEIPNYKFGSGYMQHFGHGMKRGKFRSYFPRQSLEMTADTAWYILMGPENYRLDLFKDWNTNSKTKILYLFDTLPSQYPLIKKLCSDNTWDILITSFNDAVDDLEKLTGRKWHCIEQAADESLFQPVPLTERLIHFSSYGRRNPVLHEALKEFCNSKGLYYDYTTHDAKHPVVDSPELYKQYAWHLSHSVFTFSWPVELTNPVRAGHLHPITCRWFEAAVAGTIIIGKAPANPDFIKLFNGNPVVESDFLGSKENIFRELESLWDKREILFNEALNNRNQHVKNWSWHNRVKRILTLLH